MRRIIMLAAFAGSIALLGCDEATVNDDPIPVSKEPLIDYDSTPDPALTPEYPVLDDNSSSNEANTSTGNYEVEVPSANGTQTQTSGDDPLTTGPAGTNPEDPAVLEQPVQNPPSGLD